MEEECKYAIGTGELPTGRRQTVAVSGARAPGCSPSKGADMARVRDYLRARPAAVQCGSDIARSGPREVKAGGVVQQTVAGETVDVGVQ